MNLKTDGPYLVKTLFLIRTLTYYTLEGLNLKQTWIMIKNLKIAF